MEEKKDENKASINLFKNFTIENLFEEIYNRSTEDRQKALETFDNISARFEDDEDIFMIGDKANPYLDIAQKSTDNLIKLVNAAQKFLVNDKGEIDMATVEEQLRSIISDIDNIKPPEMFNRDASKPEDEKRKQLEMIDDNKKVVKFLSAEVSMKNDKKKPSADDRLKLNIDLSEEMQERFRG